MAGLQELSTSDVPPVERLAYWNRVASQWITPLHIEARGTGPFEARLSRRSFSGWEILSPCSSPARISGAPAGDGGAFLNLQLQHRGRSVNHTAGRTAVLGEGDFVLYDTSQPLWVRFRENTQALVLRLPWDEARDRLPHIASRVGVAVSGRTGAGALFSGFLRRLWVELGRQDGAEWAEGADDTIWSMIAMVYGGGRPPVEGGPRESRRRLLFDTVERELANPDLDVHHLARQVAVSPRYVQMIFAEAGTTPHAFIRERRLVRAARRLDTEGRGASITDVAYDVGFADLSTFCRSFRRRFAVSPSAYRSGQRS